MSDRSPRLPGVLVTQSATMGGLLIVFFSAPLTGSSSTGALVLNCALAFVGVSVVAWVVVRQVTGSGRFELSPLQLVMLAEIVAFAFSMAYYSLAVAGPNFVGLHTRLDSLYFTLTTMTTVGYGDVRATSQLARGVVCVQLVFNLVFLGALARLLQRRLGDRHS